MQDQIRQIADTLERYSTDDIMLDGFWQWASNPTSYSAGYALAQNYDYTKANLRRRYALTADNTEETVNRLESECDKLAQSIDMYEIRHQIHSVLRGDLGVRLRSQVSSRIERASLSARCAVALINWLGAQNVPDYTLGSLFNEPAPPLQALLRAALGSAPGTQVASFRDLLDELIACGVINRLYYLSTKGNQRDEYVYGLTVPVLDLAAVIPKHEPLDISSYVVLLFERKLLEQARTLEEIANGRERGVPGVQEYSPYGRPGEPQDLISARGIVGVFEYFIDRSKHVIAAINPLVRNDLLEALFKAKEQRLSGLSKQVGESLKALRDRGWPVTELTTLKDVLGCKVWRLESVGKPRLFINFGNWISAGDLVFLRETGADNGDSFLFILSDQSLPSIDKVLKGSLKWWEHPSITIMTLSEKGVTMQQYQGNEHPSISEIRQFLGTTPTIQQEKKLPADEEKGGKLQPPVTPYPVSRESVILGHGSVSKEKIVWEPGKGLAVRQPNRNVLIVGKPGTGKSQLTKAFIWELHKQGIPTVALDWVNEYNDVLPKTIDAKKGITINPLQLPLGVDPYGTALEIAAIIRGVFSGLGDIQEARLRDAVLLAYEGKGIFPKEPETWGLSPPLFDDVARVLQQMTEEAAYRTAAQGVLDRIKPFVDLGIFAGATSVPFEEITRGGATVALRGLHMDEIRKTVGQFFLIKLWYYIQNLGETDKARFYLVLDEADRLAFPGSPIERIVREARKFGVGVIVASQRPRDFTETVPANAACSIVFQCPLDRDASFMARQVKCRTEDIQGLKPVFDALVKFDYEEKPLRLEALPYYIRVKS